MSDMMIAFGWGFVVGAFVFDQLWRHIRRLEAKLATLRTHAQSIADEGSGAALSGEAR